MIVSDTNLHNSKGPLYVTYPHIIFKMMWAHKSHCLFETFYYLANLIEVYSYREKNAYSDNNTSRALSFADRKTK